MKILKEAYQYWGAEGLACRTLYVLPWWLTHIILRSRFYHLKLYW